MLSIVINIGMWFERFVIIVTSLHRDFLPSAWGYFSPTIWDISCLLGSFGLFFTMFCLFARFLPMVATAEVKTVLPQADPHKQAAPERTVVADHPVVPVAAAAAAPRRWNFQMPLVPQLPEGPTYGLLAAFATPADLSTRASACVTRASAAGTPTRRSPSTAFRERWGCAVRRCRGSSSSWR